MSDRDQFQFRPTVFSSHLKPRVGDILPKVSALRITYNVDEVSDQPSECESCRFLSFSF
jgi:hypothetical protein